MTTPTFSPDGMSGGFSGGSGRRSSYGEQISQVADYIATKETWDGINAESVVRMRLQNRFLTGIDIARYPAGIMRRDMAAYDADPLQYTQSLGAWHGFV